MFKVGDKVRCIDEFRNAPLVEGREYIIESATSTSVMVTGIVNWCFSHDVFELIKEENKIKPKELLKSGMRVKTRAGHMYMVVLDFYDGDAVHPAFLAESGWNRIEYYDDNLLMTSFNQPSSDIMEIYPSVYNCNPKSTNGNGPFWVRNLNQEKIDSLEKQIEFAKNEIEKATKQIEELKGQM